MTDSHLPRDFVWGAAISAYQAEGAVAADGRGESIWDRFSATPGKVLNGDTGAVACDFYHRYAADVRLMSDLGLEAFRFSIAWPRILPQGGGRVNRAGLDFYDRLVDELLGSGIVPFVTLYHWDLPQALEDRGGWLAAETVDAFARYTEVVADRLGDRVQNWITHNEPWVAAWLGYGWGLHAPGRASRQQALVAAHNLLVSHGRSAEVLRRELPDAKVGITLNLYGVEPASDSRPDVEAASYVDGHQNRWFLDAVFRGSYPSDMVEAFGSDAPPIADGDMDLIAAPLDFLGVNYYTRYVVASGHADETLRGGRTPGAVRDTEATYTDMDWEVYPDGLFRLLVRVRDDYGPAAIYITENGSAFPDVRRHDGTVIDPQRQEYLAGHIEALGRASRAGAPLKGYFAWSLLDNFELAHGYSKRFGLVYVDYPTLERVPKASYHLYKSIIERHRHR